MTAQRNPKSRAQRSPKQPGPLGLHTQTADLVDMLATFLGNNLAGVYTVATPTSTSGEVRGLTLLVVLQRSLRLDARLALLQTLLRHSTTAWPVAAFFVRASDIAAGQPPTPLELHYDENRRAALALEVIGPRWLQWPELPTEMADLTKLMAALHQAGNTFKGTALAELVPPSPALPEERQPASPPEPDAGEQLSLDTEP